MNHALSIIEKHYSKGSDIYTLLLKHSEQVRDKALLVIKKHPEIQLDSSFVEEASLLHDIGIFMCHAPDIFCLGSHLYIEHGYLGADLLRQEGLTKHALVCERHTGVGLSLEAIIQNKLPLPHREMVPVSIEEKLICYADKFYSKSTPDKEISIDHIRKHLMHYDAEQVRVFDEWHSLFG